MKLTNADAALTELRDAIKTNKWDSPTVKAFKAVKNELTTTTQGIILRGTRIVIPAVLQQRAIDIAHESRLGIEKKKSLIREKIWFPQIDSRVKDTIEQCITCQACRMLTGQYTFRIITLFISLRSGKRKPASTGVRRSVLANDEG